VCSSDLIFWNDNNRKEYLSVARTWLMEGIFIGIYSRLWSDVPWFRPMATCVEETVDSRRPDGLYRHHFVKTHCCAEVMEARTGLAGLNACHLNILQAIEPFGLTEEDIHDNLCVHQKTKLDPATGKSISARTTAQRGDYIEFYANLDLLVAVSVCPNGDNTAHQNEVVRPIGIEIYDTEIPPKEFPQWTNWRLAWKGKWQPPNIATAVNPQRGEQ